MANQLFTIPLVASPQTFDIELGGRSLTITNKWNESCGWVLDIYDATTTAPLVMNLPLVTGTNLLKQLSYLGIPGEIYVQTDGDAGAVPTLTNLGVASFVYYVVAP